MQTLSNDILTIAVNDHGAELASLRRGPRQYLWQADRAFWQRHSPVLFPFVGSSWMGEYRAKGTTLKMGQHGFARDMEFTLTGRTDTSLTYRLASDADTLGRYPYAFILDITYELIGNRVRVHWRVTNPADEVLPFQIGAHPAFYWPMLTDAEIDGGVEASARALAETDRRGYFRIEPAAKSLPLSKVTERGCIGATSSIDLDDGWLALSVETFSRDALVIEDSLIKKVTLCDNDRRPYLSMEFDSPAVGLWSPPGKRAPFVCIEPWYGRADNVAFDGDICGKRLINLLEPGGVFDVYYDIIIE